jgi:hypothetical protein
MISLESLSMAMIVKSTKMWSILYLTHQNSDDLSGVKRKEEKRGKERKFNWRDQVGSVLLCSAFSNPYHTVCSEKRRKVEEEKEEGISKSEGFWRVPAICVRPPGAGLEDKVLNGLVEVGLVDKRKWWGIEQEDSEKRIEKRKHRRSVRLRNFLDVAPMSSLIVRHVLSAAGW